MNPLYWAGPQFLMFYAAVGVAMLLLLWYLRTEREGGNPPRINAADPYLIAFLRGGESEAARVAAISLIDRGLLAEQGGNLEASSDGTAERVHRPIEKAVLGVFRIPREPESIFGNAAVSAACIEYQNTLSGLGLIPDDQIRSARWTQLMLALFVLVLLAGAKTAVALHGGRGNVLFLLFLAVLFCFLCWKLINQYRTVRGNDVLEGLQRLYTRLKARAAVLTPGGATADLALLVAVFGIGPLTTTRFGWAQRLYPKAKDRDSSSCGSTCGSSSGSSGCGGGGGSGCGGCGGGGGD